MFIFLSQNVATIVARSKICTFFKVEGGLQLMLLVPTEPKYCVALLSIKWNVSGEEVTN